MDDTKTHIISSDLARFREADRCCPACNDGTRIVKRQRVTVDKEQDTITFGGFYWVCDRYPEDYDHYQYSPGGGRNGAKPRETVGVVVPRKFMPPPPYVPSARVVKRNADGSHTPLSVR